MDRGKNFKYICIFNSLGTGHTLIRVITEAMHCMC